MTDTAGLMHILQICDSLFPVGAFTLSNGLETYVQHDIITSPKELEEYLHSYISVLPYNELGATAAAYNADENETEAGYKRDSCQKPGAPEGKGEHYPERTED